jgi:hypothetical protein
MRVLLTSFLVLASVAASAQQRSDPGALVAYLSEAALLGMQLPMQRAAQQNKVPQALAKCVAEIRPTAFESTFVSLLSKSLSTAELKDAQDFFSSSVGRKLSKLDLLQIHAALGVAPPEPLPSFSDAEYKEVEAFARTTAGDKLIVKRVLETPAARQSVRERIKELLAACGR